MLSYMQQGQPLCMLTASSCQCGVLPYWRYIVQTFVEKAFVENSFCRTKTTEQQSVREWAISTFSPVSSSNVCERERESVCVCVHWHSTEWPDMRICRHSAHFKLILSAPPPTPTPSTHMHTHNNATHHTRTQHMHSQIITRTMYQRG